MTEVIELEYLPRYNWRDYLEFGGKWELIHGVPYNMAPAPVKKH